MTITYRAYEPIYHGLERMESLGRLSQHEAMLELTPYKIQSNSLATIALCGTEVVGYIAQTNLYPNDVAEVGSLIVKNEYRNLGIAHELVRICTTKVVLSGVQSVIAFCNQKSSTIFTERGYKKVSLCQQELGCPKNMGGGCCNRAYMFID